jgi:hypothetical protein
MIDIYATVGTFADAHKLAAEASSLRRRTIRA